MCHAFENKTRASGIELVCSHIQLIRQLLEVKFVDVSDELWNSREVCHNALYTVFSLTGKSNIDSDHDANRAKKTKISSMSGRREKQEAGMLGKTVTFTHFFRPVSVVISETYAYHI